ncbi:MAG: Gx transporter family protein [Ruminococcus sp.]|nr:Gx transporter family protein [Ruminococcus sp.]MBP3309784.1 Gx transporter family protein [Ruminococcus sp.]
MKTKRLAELSMLTAVALIIFIIELRIPDILTVPGVKLGLANIITVYAVYRFNAKEVCLVVFTRVILGTVFSANFSAIIYSLAGAVLCLVGMLGVKKIISQRYIWLSSIIGAILHNTGQIVAAILIMRSFAVAVYYPMLIIAGCIAGMFTGICAQLIVSRKLPEK